MAPKSNSRGPPRGGLEVSGAPAARAASGKRSSVAALPGKRRTSSRTPATGATGSASQPSKIKAPQTHKLDSKALAAIKIQAVVRGRIGRVLAARQRARVEQQRQEEAEQRAREERRRAAEKAKAEAEEAAKLQAVAQKEAQIRALRNRRCAVEQMCQGLQSHTMDWEEEPSKLIELLERPESKAATEQVASAEDWLGCHTGRKSARKCYLQLARKWHPDKWAVQGDLCMEVATDVTKRLVAAFEQLCKELPNDTGIISREDDDEEKEVCEFASWVGISFQGMHEVWKERRRVTVGKR
eukprot:TRINITY_DN13906_c0_g1_i1.p1 TRINITY_DN13906_c0_g1~~TRINITY_DN13906_c0_g1_i1.p1  ORF type:complete len:298 (-),score=90.11 TRINITY_DN13906_c0_g1_i1:208-1101(-)